MKYLPSILVAVLGVATVGIASERIGGGAAGAREDSTPAARAVIRFCGNGANATTENYTGPVRIEDYESAGTAVEDGFVFGGGTCGNQDNTTIATADQPMDWGPFDYYPRTLMCITDCGTDDVATFQLYDDTAAVSGMSCSVTLTGSNVTCRASEGGLAAITGTSAIAVGVVNDTDDDCSAGNIECWLFVDF